MVCDRMIRFTWGPVNDIKILDNVLDELLLKIDFHKLYRLICNTRREADDKLLNSSGNVSP
jgi:hypothetical protein